MVPRVAIHHPSRRDRQLILRGPGCSPRRSGSVHIPLLVTRELVNAGTLRWMKYRPAAPLRPPLIGFKIVSSTFVSGCVTGIAKPHRSRAETTPNQHPQYPVNRRLSAIKRPTLTGRMDGHSAESLNGLVRIRRNTSRDAQHYQRECPKRSLSTGRPQGARVVGGRRSRDTTRQSRCIKSANAQPSPASRAAARITVPAAIRRGPQDGRCMNLKASLSTGRERGIRYRWKEGPRNRRAITAGEVIERSTQAIAKSQGHACGICSQASLTPLWRECMPQSPPLYW